MTTTTTDSGMRQLLEALASTQATDHPARQGDAPTFASVVSAGKTTGWDPHEVWLDRIKKPRDDRSVER